jgi:hypothetical protein
MLRRRVRRLLFTHQLRARRAQADWGEEDEDDEEDGSERDQEWRLALCSPAVESGVGVCLGQQTDDAMQTLIRATMASRYTPHGLRSSFMDWVGELDPLPLLKDHRIGSQVQWAYLC